MNHWNPYKRLLALLPEPVTDVGTVLEVLGDGCRVELLNGSEANVKGAAEVGDPVYIRDGAIIGPAPVLSSVEIEV